MVEFVNEHRGRLTVRDHKFRDDCLVFSALGGVDLNESEVANLLNVLEGFLERRKV